MELSNYLPQVVSSSSRIVQESITVGQGVSAYGVLASFIDTNIAMIDKLAEYLADQAAQKAVGALYDRQYFDSNVKYKNILTRNKYLSSDKRESLQHERYITGFLTATAAEAAIKYGSRALGKWLNQKDTFITCEQLYSVLVSFVVNADAKANKTRARIELAKIRNSLPLSVSDRKKLSEKYNTTTPLLENLDISSIMSTKNNELRNAISFFIAVLRRQLFESETSNDRSALDYYSLIDINGQYGKELLNENENKYDIIAADQTAYLQMARGLMKNMFLDKPNIDLEAIKARTDELSKYDPYSIRRKKLKGVNNASSLKIGNIILGNPDTALSGISTMLSQFEVSDELLQFSKDALSKWGISGNEFDLFTQNAGFIRNKSNESDLISFAS